MKKLLYTFLAVSIIFSACEKEEEEPTNNTNNNNSGNSTNLAIGDSHQGGIIFYLDGNGSGLIAAPTDQSNAAEWGCEGTNLSEADGTAIGTGNQNTVYIESGCTTPGIAADICANLTLGGYSDWFLPSIDELKEMYVNKDAINTTAIANGGSSFTFNRYWSSTDLASPPFNRAWGQNFYNDEPFFSNKSYPHFVRAVRAF
jgi:hypothetical protein